MGNFFNSEIVGKPAPDSPFAVLFPQQSMEYGEIVPRYPTQLFEAFSYLALFFVMWEFIFTRRKIQSRLAFRVFLCLYFGPSDF